MPTSFPTALDNFTNPTSSDLQSSVTVPHAEQHANKNDAIEALEAKVGVDGSAVTTTHDYKLSAITGTEKAVSNVNFSGTSYGTNTGDQNLFSSIVVTGQPTLTATGTTSSLTIIGSGVAVTTNTGTGSLTFSVSTGFISAIAISGVVTGSGTSSITLTHVGPTGAGATVLQNAPTISGVALVGTTVVSGTIELGHASDTTISRVSSGVVAIEGATIETSSTIANSKIANIAFIIDGGGSTISSGLKGFLEVPFACTINRATALADQSGSIVVDVWKEAYANFPPTDSDSITASAPITISTGTSSQDSSLSGWTTTITAGDILGFNVDSVATHTRVTVSLKVTKT